MHSETRRRHPGPPRSVQQTLSMRTNLTSQSGSILKLRVFLAFILSCAGALLTIFSLAAPNPETSWLRRASPYQRESAPRLSVERLNFSARSTSAAGGPATSRSTTSNSTTSAGANAPTLGHPIISGIGGTGFEQSIRLDPTDPNRIYTSAPGTLSADTSWIWHSLDGGRTFKWVVGAAPFEGKVTTCHGGGDSEIAVDSAGHLYFNDLTLLNFSGARSDDFGATFTCSNTSVPEAVVDRQWYAIDGDPTNGGSLYLVNDIIGPGAPSCGSSAGNNVLEMYRSPVNPLLGATAGIEFGPANHVSGVDTCDEGIMGNNEISPVPTTLGQPNGLGGYTTLPAAVKHIFVIHDNAQFNKIFVGRCFPVAFGAPVANVSDPSGLNCTDILVADLGANQKTGANFPTMAIDNAGTLYAVWEQAPLGPDTNATGDLAITGDTVLKFSYSTDQGNTWSTPMTIDTSGSPDGVLHNNVFAWINAGDDGRVNIVWYGTNAVANLGSTFDFIGCGQNVLNPPPGGKNINGPDAVDGLWSVWMVQSVNAHDSAGPVFTAPIRASAHPAHRGSVQTVIGGQCGWASRALGDYLQLRTGPQGEAHISYADSNSIVGALVGHAMYVHQNGGTGLFATPTLVNVPGITPYNGVTDPSGDGKYEASGSSSANMPQLDILSSNITKVTSSPCSAAAPCYKVFMQLSDLSLAPTTAQDPDPDLVWQTQWFVPSTTDPNGGKDFHVYAESFNGGALQCFVGENDFQLVSGGAVITYPGTTQLPAANCQSTLGPNGNITIYIPLSDVTEVNPIDNRLHEVTASTMTLLEPANTQQRDPVEGSGGSFFNLIDVAQGYVFDPAGSPVTAVSRKVHTGAGTFDVALPLIGTPGIECRGGSAGNVHQVVITFPGPVTVTDATLTPGPGGTGSIVLAPGHQPPSEVVATLSNVSNAQTLTINLLGVSDGSNTFDVHVPMSVLLADVNANGVLTNADVSLVKAQVAAGGNVDSSNFRNDVNANGVITNADVSITKAQVAAGAQLPP
jgi:hypothetical protein